MKFSINLDKFRTRIQTKYRQNLDIIQTKYRQNLDVFRIWKIQCIQTLENLLYLDGVLNLSKFLKFSTPEFADGADQDVSSTKSKCQFLLNSEQHYKEVCTATDQYKWFRTIAQYVPLQHCAIPSMQRVCTLRQTQSQDCDVTVTQQSGNAAGITLY